MLARQALWWTPGNASGYHALLMGHLLGELVRRVSGKSFREFVATEISAPLGVDFQVGAPRRKIGREFQQSSPPENTGISPDFEPGSVQAETSLNPPLDSRSVNTEP
ncbi:Beta-lactamase [Fusarium sp. LHS14.1]|nr:Beta-lactamase [Fusarium sp. LHS14.1]